MFLRYHPFGNWRHQPNYRHYVSYSSTTHKHTYTREKSNASCIVLVIIEYTNGLRTFLVLESHKAEATPVSGHFVCCNMGANVSLQRACA